MKLVTKTKISWKHLTKLISDEHKLMEHLFRLPDIQRNYYLHRSKVNKMYTTFEDYIKISLFRFGSIDDNDGRIMSYPTPTSLTRSWNENVYPYSLRKGIRHYNIWSLSSMSSQEVETMIKTCIPLSKHVLWFVNEPHDMSVPGIWHCHVFWK